MANVRAGLDEKAIDKALADLDALGCCFCSELPHNAVQLPSSNNSLCEGCAAKLPLDPATQLPKDPYNQKPFNLNELRPNRWARDIMPIVPILRDAVIALRKPATPSAAAPQLAAHEQTLAATVAELQSLQKKHAADNAELQRLQKILQEERISHATVMQTRAADHKAEAQRLHNALQQERTQSSALIKANAAQQAEAQQLRDALQQTRTDKQVAAAKMARQDGVIQQCREHIADLQRAHSEQHKKLAAASHFEALYRDLERQHEAERAQHQIAVAQLTTQNATLKAESGALTEVIKAERARHQAQEREHQQAKQQLEQQLQQAREQLQQSKAAQAAAEAQAQQLTKDKSRLQSQADASLRAVMEHITESDQLKTKLQLLTKAHGALQATSASLNDAHSAHAAKLTTDLAAAQAEVSKLKLELAAAKSAPAAAVRSRRSATPTAGSSQARRASVPFLPAPAPQLMHAATAAVSSEKTGRAQLLSAQRAAAAHEDAQHSGADKKSDYAAAAGSGGSTVVATHVDASALQRAGERRASLSHVSLSANLNGFHLHNKRHSDGGIDHYAAQEKAANTAIGTKLSLQTVLHLKADNLILVGLQTQLVHLAKGMNQAQQMKFATFIETRLTEKFKDNRKDDLTPIISSICKAIDPNFVLAAKRIIKSTCSSL